MNRMSKMMLQVAKFAFQMYAFIVYVVIKTKYLTYKVFSARILS